MREEIPGYREAIEREQFLRDCAFLPINETICGIEALPLNLQHVLFLSVAESPFAYWPLNRADIRRLRPAARDGFIQQFFWIVSPNYHPRRRWAKMRLAIRVSKIPAEKAIDAICDYLAESFHDAEAGEIRKSYYSFAAGMIGCLVPKYGSDEDVLRKSLKRLFQYTRMEALRGGETLFNRSDEVRRLWRVERNKIERQNLERQNRGA